MHDEKPPDEKTSSARKLITGILIGGVMWLGVHAYNRSRPEIIPQVVAITNTVTYFVPSATSTNTITADAFTSGSEQATISEACFELGFATAKALCEERLTTEHAQKVRELLKKAHKAETSQSK